MHNVFSSWPSLQRIQRCNQVQLPYILTEDHHHHLWYPDCRSCDVLCGDPGCSSGLLLLVAAVWRHRHPPHQHRRGRHHHHLLLGVNPHLPAATKQPSLTERRPRTWNWTRPSSSSPKKKEKEGEPDRSNNADVERTLCCSWRKNQTLQAVIKDYSL
ncbi:hypothetical protein Pcinc_012782 [Petrolisthes cinctipes]|uniref:Uncharacterized protein n=1 Tax=Petrolisthes cinctipes TaxID=88211 RepID=A0AAE1FY71_PETCI|nr:hypothetical protein Pcinc_012782 [Petrolisthes cinctipes]